MSNYESSDEPNWDTETKYLLLKFTTEYTVDLKYEHHTIFK